MISAIAEERLVQAPTLGEGFAAVVARAGERVAVTCGDERVTYAELSARAARVAGGLRAAGVRRGDVVAICMERSIEMIVAMLGVVKAGGIYLPIDARYPEARVAETVANAGAVLLLRELVDGAAGEDVEVEPEDAAYVIYTSGSTGKPKGVVVTQGNVMRLVSATEPWFEFGESDVWTMFHSFAFDFSVWEIWGCLLTGGRLVVVPFQVSRAPEEFRELLVREGVTVLNQTPSAFALLDRVDADGAIGDLKLRVVVFGGEALAGAQLRGWFARHGDQKPAMVNMYGITETTVHVTYRRMLRADERERESLLGVAIPDMSILLLDEQGEEVLEGEICVAGAGVARGYLNRAELTAQKFVETTRFGRVYRSGDIGRRRGDGELVYLGRRDGQVKVNGFRVELGEVEAGLLGCAGVSQACVCVEDGLLVGYFVGREKLAAGVLSAELGRTLPGHMMPSRYVQVQAMPLNGNGKVDRAALAEAGRVRVQVKATGMQGLVAKVWTDVLGGGFGVEDNFFDVGGSSLLLVRVRSALQTELGKVIPVTWMFECTTVKALAERLESGVKDVVVGGNGARQREAFAKAKAMRSVTK